jgi:hypothetical protein
MGLAYSGLAIGYRFSLSLKFICEGMIYGPTLDTGVCVQHALLT